MSTDKVVGIIDEETAELAGIEYTGKIYASSGVSSSMNPTTLSVDI